MYALPYEYYQKYGIRKYGFHGTSHKFVAREGAKLAGLDINNSKIITCHIGNGGSITAVLNGKSYDTSMGFSPVVVWSWAPAAATSIRARSPSSAKRSK